MTNEAVRPAAHGRLARARDAVVARSRRKRGRAVVIGALVVYFLFLFAIGGRDHWQRFGVPPGPVEFADLELVTVAWECDREGVPVLPENPCDPFLRPNNYPQLWLLPSALGVGEEATVPLAVAMAALFFAAFLILMGRATIWEGLLYSAALTSPAVMLGVERGNIDLIVFAVLVGAVVLFRRSPALRVASHALFLLAAILKLFPVFAWGALVRQSRRWVIWGVGAVAFMFLAYVVATWGEIQTFLGEVPQANGISFGADVTTEAIQGHSASFWLPIEALLDWEARRESLDWYAQESAGNVMTAALVLGAAAVAGILAWRRRGYRAWPTANEAPSWGIDAFLAGAGIYVGTFALEHNWDYRLAFLLLTLPQLVAWARSGSGPVPAPRITFAAVLGTLWLGAFFTRLGLYYDELLNWLLFVNLGAALIGLLVIPRLREGKRVARRLGGSWP